MALGSLAQMKPGTRRGPWVKFARFGGRLVVSVSTRKSGRPSSTSSAWSGLPACAASALPGSGTYGSDPWLWS